jgi:hypothetical protein
MLKRILVSKRDDIVGGKMMKLFLKQEEETHKVVRRRGSHTV